MYITVFALYPFSSTSKHGQVVPWHLVLFNKWFNLHRFFPATWQTALTMDDSVLHFSRYWGTPNGINDLDEDTPYYFKVMNLPWARYSKRHYHLKNGKWELLPDKYEPMAEALKTGDKYHTTFSFMENGKRVIVKAEVHAERRLYCWWWLPKWLPIFPVDKKVIEINLNEDIGKGRGSWKGGMMGRSYPFNKSIKDSWNDFYYKELPKYLKGEK